MSVKIIQERLDSYQPKSQQEEEFALKEILQEIALAGLSRTDFFKYAAFQGGTALRILYSLDRFSEDLDFIGTKAEPGFRWSDYLQNLETEFMAYGIEVKAEDRSQLSDETVKKAFLKDQSFGKIMTLNHWGKSGRIGSIRIKFEIDTNPPAGSRSETKYLDFPFATAVIVQDPPSLFAGKSHALLCRSYVKGRDWYDFLWYVSRKTPINFEFLFKACEQQGPWAGQSFNRDKAWYLSEMDKKIRAIDWSDAKKDVARFLRQASLSTLDLWSLEFFLDRLKKMEGYL